MKLKYEARMMVYVDREIVLTEAEKEALQGMTSGEFDSFLLGLATRSAVEAVEAGDDEVEFDHLSWRLEHG